MMRVGRDGFPARHSAMQKEGHTIMASGPERRTVAFGRSLLPGVPRPLDLTNAESGLH